MVAIVLAGTWSRPGWEYEWNWALSWAASSTVLLGPLLAGLVAHDRARRHAPTLTGVERSSARGYLGALSVPLAAFIIGMVAWVTAATVVSAWVARNQPVGTPDLTILLEVVAVLLACAFLGAAIGAWVTSRAAGPLTAVAVYVLFVAAPHVQLGGLMSAGGAVGSLIGLQRNTQWLAGFLIVHASIFAAGALLMAARSSASLRHRIAATISAGLVLIVGATSFLMFKADGPYVAVTAEPVCLGDAPTVCGPRELQRPLEIARDGLVAAYADLANSGLPLRQQYSIERGLVGQIFPPDSGVLTLDSGTFSDGVYSRGDLLMTLATPTMCEAYYEADAPTDLLDAQSTVMRWIDQRVYGENDGDVAPDDVQDSYRLLLDCAPRLTHL